MAELNINEVKEMAYDLYKGRTANFDSKSANEAIKNIILEAGGCADEWDYLRFQENKYKVFRIWREILTPIVAENVLDRYQSWVDIEDIALGDTRDFETMNEDLFEIGYVADGTSELRRQTLTHGKIAMSSFPLGAKLGCEFDDFRRGRVDFAGWINRLGVSFEVAIGQYIVKGVEKSYDFLKAPFKASGAYDDDELLRIVQNVEAKSRKNTVIYGTKLALAQLRKSEGHSDLSDGDKEAISRQGHIETFYGTRIQEIPQSLDRKDNVMLSDTMLYVIPDGTKIVKLLFEGGVDIVEVNSPATRMDMQFEYMFMRRIQLGVCRASVYGVYKIG